MGLLGKRGAESVGLGAVSHLVLTIALSGHTLAQTAGGLNQTPAAENPSTLPPVVIEPSTPRRGKKQAAQTSSRNRTVVTARQANRGTGAPQAAPGGGGGETASGPVDGIVATRSATGTKTDTPLIETPAAISVVTRDEIQAQAAQNVPQAVRYTSGTRADLFGADSRFDDVFIRGFQADFYLDGLRQMTGGFSQPIIDPYNLERIEILHGPASVLYGQSSPGGVVDLVSKRPTTDPYHEIFFSTGSYGRVQGGIDLSGPIDQNKEWLYRFTASGFDVGTQVDDRRYERVSIAPSLTWRPDQDTSITFLGTYQNDPKAGFFNQLPTFGTLLPLAGHFIPTNFNISDPNIDKMSRELAQIGYLAEHRFDDIWTVRQHLRYSNLSTDLTTLILTGQTGEAACNSSTCVGRSSFSEHDKLSTLDIDNQAEAKFRTGPLSHTLLLGVDYQNGTFNFNDADSTLVPGITVNSIDILDPIYGNPISGPVPTTGISKQDFSQVGLYAQDQIKLGNWVALLGARWDQADANTQSWTLVSPTTGTPQSTVVSQSNEATTKRAALLYKFDNGIAPYIQYTESFQPAVGQVDFNGNPFAPTTGRQEEAGIKYQPDPKSLYTLAAFNLTQQNVLTPDLSHPGFQVQTGEIRSRGLELEGKTQLNSSLALHGSYTYTDPVITASNIPGVAGRREFGIPMNSAALWADYTFHGGQLDGFGFSGGVRYLGESAANIAGPTVLNVPAVTLFDAGLHYDLAGLGPQFKGLQFQINASNLFDKTYLTLCQDNGCYYGLRRQVIATLRYRW